MAGGLPGDEPDLGGGVDRSVADVPADLAALAAGAAATEAPVKDGAVNQGVAAKALGLTEADCPYGPGFWRDAWMEGFGG